MIDCFSSARPIACSVFQTYLIIGPVSSPIIVSALVSDRYRLDFLSRILVGWPVLSRRKPKLSVRSSRIVFRER